MRSRLRRVVILGPPLVMVLTVGSGFRGAPGVAAGSLALPTQLVACVAPDATATAAPGSADGTWWDQRPITDVQGSLTGWTVTIGAPRARSLALDLPPGSFVSGPIQGRILATVEDGAHSTIEVIDTTARCSRSLPIERSIARRAVLTRDGSTALVHLLERGTRTDLGTWQVPLDGSRPTQLLVPPTTELLRRAGIKRVWSTDLILSADGARLAVQSCDPDRCLTRVLDVATGAIATIDREHGSIIGIVGRMLITRAACPGLPCDILAWDLGTGRSKAIATGTAGAAVTRDGRVVVIRRMADGTTTATLVDLASERRVALGQLERGVFLQDGTGTTGIETPSDAIGLIRPGGPPTFLDIATSPARARGNRP